MPNCRYSMIQAAAALLASLALVLVSGCLAAKPGKVDSALVGPERPFAAGASLAEAGEETHVLLIRLHIVSIEVPVGTASGSEDIWSYLDEEAVRAVRTPALGFNGLRAGIGRAASWGDLAEVLKRMTGRRLAESAAVALPGNPMPIVLKAEQPAETLFVFDRQRRLTGLDYPAGDRLLAVVCTLNEDDPSQTMITAVPQIRTTRLRPGIRQEEDQLLMVAEPDVISIDPLTIQAMVPAGDFLVIGPGVESPRASSVGHALLVKQREGMEFETVLILKPEVFATTVRTASPAGAIR